MNDKLLKNEYVPYARTGETVRKEHCKPGKDKLYITEDGGKILAFCHHCGKSGCHYTKPQVMYLETDTTKTHNTYKPPPKDLRSLEYMKPAWVVNWLNNMEIPYYVLSEKHGLKYSPSRDVVYIPCVGGYQERQNSPVKYLTYKEPSSKVMYFNPCIHYNLDGAVLDEGFHTVYLVEDALSAIKIDYYSSYLTTAIASLGTHISIEMRNMLIKLQPRQFIIWLDNDNKNVLKSVSKIQKDLSLITDVHVVNDVIDPKNLPYAHLVSLVAKLKECI